MARRKAEKATAPANPQDFTKLYEEFQKRIVSDDVLSKDAVLNELIKNFGRLAKQNEALWQDILDTGYTGVDLKTGRSYVNPSIAAFNKNAALLLKYGDSISERTKSVSAGTEEKSW